MWASERDGEVQGRDEERMSRFDVLNAQAAKRFPIARRTQLLKLVTLAAAPLAGFTPRSHAYSVMAQEAIIDSAWDSAIKPLLLK